MVKKCIILAGGFGTRLYPLTIDKPKALLEYKGKPVISHIINMVPKNIEIFVTINRRFEAYFHDWQSGVGRQVELLVESATNEEQKLGAVSALDFWVKHEKIANDLLVIAGDNYLEFDLTEFISAYDGQHTLVAVYDIGNKDKAKQFGVVKLLHHRIVKLEEKPVAPVSSLVAVACYIFPVRIFPLLSEYCCRSKKDNLGDFISYLVANDNVHAYVFTEAWLDVGMVQS